MYIEARPSSASCKLISLWLWKLQMNLFFSTAKPEEDSYSQDEIHMFTAGVKKAPLVSFNTWMAKKSLKEGVGRIGTQKTLSSFFILAV